MAYIFHYNDRDDISTWDIMKASGKYGLSTRGPCFNAALVHNRQNPLLASVLAAVVGTAVWDIAVSHDRCEDEANIHMLRLNLALFDVSSCVLNRLAAYSATLIR